MTILFRKKYGARVLAAGALLASAAGGCNFHETKSGHDGPQPPALTGGGEAAYARLAAELFGPTCARCHNPGRSAAGVDVTSYGAIAAGRTSGGEALVVAGQPGASALSNAVTSGRMPPGGGGVEPALQAALVCWIEKGAPEQGAGECFADAGGAGGEAGGGVAGGDDDHGGDRDRDDHDDDDDDDRNDDRDDRRDDDRDDDGGVTDGGGGPGAPRFAQIKARVLDAYRCTRCHGAESPAEGINLTTYAATRNGRGVFGDDNTRPSEPLLTPGAPARSLLWRVVETGRMPFGAPVAAADKALLKQWIEQGARE